MSVCAQLCLTLYGPMDCSHGQLFCPWNFPGKNTGVSGHFFLQGIFLTQVSFISCIGRWIFLPPGKSLHSMYYLKKADFGTFQYNPEV